MRQLKISKSITNRETASLDKYLQDIGKEQMITPDEEVDLARRIKAGDERALEKLTKANLRFVVSVAKQYQNQGISLPDLINEGNVGLIKAARRFDETRGFKFISYAVWWIRQAILQAIAEQSRLVRLPLNQVGSLNKLKKEISMLEQKFERPPTVAELSISLDISEYKVREFLKINSNYISMDAPIAPDEDTKLVDTFAGTENQETDMSLMHESLTDEIKRTVSTLSEKEKEVLFMYYGIGHDHEYTLEEIGAQFDLTRERVRQIKEKAIRRLKHSNKSKNLRAYL